MIRVRERPGSITRPAWLALPVAAALLLGCTESPQTEQPRQPTVEHTPLSSDPALAAAHQLALATRQGLCTSASLLESQVAELTEAPSRPRLDSARGAWRTAHQSWRLWQRLLLVADLGDAATIQPLIDAEPILPGYLDSVPGYPVSGLVHSDVPLDPQSLADAHQSTDLYYGVLGFHPLEFMLWGVPDDNGKPTRKAGAFEPEAEREADALPATDRRRALTLSMAGLLQLAVEEHCAPTMALPDLGKLALFFEAGAGEGEAGNVEQKRIMLVAWLDQLTQTLAEWKRQPGGEDANGMPLWHNAFARVDFAEIQTEWSWLVQRFWPEAGPDVTSTGQLDQALESLAEAAPAPPPQKRLIAAHEAALQLAQTLAEGSVSAADTSASPSR